MNADEPASELLIAGAKSYPQVLLALNEFCSRIVRIVEDAVRQDLDELAKSMTINFSAADVKQRFRPDGFHYGEIQGEARIGVAIRQAKAEGWNLYLEFYWEDDDFGFAVRISNKDAIQESKMIAAFRNSIQKVPGGYQAAVKGTGLLMCRPIGVDEMSDLPKIVRDTIVEWCAVWKRIGGVKQFPAKSQGSSQ